MTEIVPARPVLASRARTVKTNLFQIVLVIAILYFGREFFIPIALAILISFLLAPVVTQLEKYRLGRIGSVIVVTLLSFTVIGLLGMLLGGQLIDLADQLPRYKSNLHEKIAAFKPQKDGAIARASETLKDLTDELSTESANPAPTPTTGPGQPATRTTGVSVDTPGAEKVTVAVVQPTTNSFQSLWSLISPVLAPLGTAAIVVIFVIFILLEREDLRDRMIHLIAHGQLRVTTEALDLAASRVSRYLMAQLIVNVTYGIPIGVGLYFIGVPNSFLWGLLATILRFIPYLGPWIAAAFPLALSLAISKSWAMPLQAIGLFLLVELISNNVVEPWLYGASTGLSPVAVIAAAAFWTWLWGTMGLLLATPLTVCIAVLGKYIPSLRFLDLLLGDKPPISPEDRFYQRLLAADEDEVCEITETYRAKRTLAETFDLLLIPALRLADDDFHSGNLSEQARNRIYEIVRDLVADLKSDHELAATSGTAPALPAAGTAPGTNDPAVAICVPASDYADEVIGLMLEKLLAQSGQGMIVVPSKFLASETIATVAESPTRLICISVLPPGSTRHAIYLSKRLRDSFPDARLLVGMWAEPAGDDHRLQRFRQVKVDGVFTSLQDVAKEILATGRVIPATMTVNQPDPEQVTPEAGATAASARTSGTTNAVAKRGATPALNG